MGTERYYPVCLNLADAPCVVIGGGRVAARKVASLLDCGARVTVVSPAASDDIRGWSKEGSIAWRAESYRSDHIDGAQLVIAATSDRLVNARVFTDARGARIPVNAVDDPEHCTFIVPAVYRRGDILIAVSTGGGAPGVSARIRDKAGRLVGEEWAVLVRTLKANRDRIRSLPAESKSEFRRRLRGITVEEYAGRPEALEGQVLKVLDGLAPGPGRVTEGDAPA